MRKVKIHPSLQGFTLFELLIVLIILSVIMGLILPRFKGSVGSLELVKVVYDINGLLKRAVVESRVEGVEYRLLMDNNRRRYSLKKLMGKRLVSVVSRPLPRNIYLFSSKNPLMFHSDGRMDITDIYVFAADTSFYRDLRNLLGKEFSLGQIQSITHTEYIYTISVKKGGKIEILPPGKKK